jgi:hypothetical protein
LDQRLSTLGEVVPVGSAALGLMVWRDLDLTVVCRSLVGEMWKVDIWVVDDPDQQPDPAHVRDLPKRLTTETRAAILGVKDAWAGRPEYRRAVRSWDVYAAVLDHGCGRPLSSRPAAAPGTLTQRRSWRREATCLGPGQGFVVLSWCRVHPRLIPRVARGRP